MMDIMNLIKHLALLLIVTRLAFGEVGREYRGQIYHNIGNDEKVLDKANLMVLGLTLWDSTLQDAQRTIGAWPIQERRYTSGRYISQLCYEGSGGVLL